MRTILSLFIYISCSAFFSQTITWTGATDNNWHRACNWDLNTIPTCIQNAIIPNGNIVNITAIAHCMTIDLQGTSDLNITTGILEVSDANTCVGLATDSGGCLVPGSAFTGSCGGSCTLGVFTCFGPIPASGDCVSWTNNTDFPITLDVSAATGTVLPPCGTWSPFPTSVIPPMSSGGFCFSVPANCCPFTNAEPISIPWTSSDGGSGNVSVIIRTDID